ncbi:MAG: SprB repeat-containing protein [Bacteroidia bacterium]
MKTMKIVLLPAVLLFVNCFLNQGFAQVGLSGIYSSGEHYFSEESHIVASPSTSESFEVSGTANVVVNSSTGITLKPGFKASSFSTGGKFHAFISSMLQYTLESQNATLDTLGSASITVTGGTAPYSFNWNGEQFPTMEQLTAAIQNSPEIQNLDFDFGNLNDFSAQITGAQRSELESDMYEVLIKDKRGTSVKVDVPISSPTYWYNSLGLGINGNSITKMDPDGWSSGYATSLNFIEQGEDGMLMFYVGNLNSTQAVGFKSLDAVFDPGYADMAYGVLVENNEIKSITDGVASATITTYNEGDKLYLEKKGGNILLKKNKEIIHSTPVNAEKTLQADVALYSLTAQVNIATIRLRVHPKLTGVVTDLTCNDEDIQSAININLSLPYSNNTYNIEYKWFYIDNNEEALQILNGTADYTTEDLSNVPPGKYVLLVTYSIPSITGYSLPMHLMKTFYVGYKANWVDRINSITSPNDQSLKKATIYNNTQQLSLNDNSGASTTNILSTQTEDVLDYYAFNLKNTGVPLYLAVAGFNDNLTYDELSEIDYGIAILKFFNTTLLLTKNIEDDAQFHFRQPPLPVNSLTNPNTTISAEIQNNGTANKIKYYWDTGMTPFYQEELTNFSLPENVHASIVVPNNVIHDAKTSFPCGEINFEDFKSKPFAKLNKKLDGGYHICDPSDGVLCFEFDEEYIEGGFTYNVYNWQNDVILSNANDNNQIFSNTNLNIINSDLKDFGDNRFVIVPEQVFPDGMYILETINDKNEKMYLRFRKG